MPVALCGPQGLWDDALTTGLAFCLFYALAPRAVQGLLSFLRLVFGQRGIDAAVAFVPRM